MSRLSAAEWLDRVRGATPGPELLGFVTRRLATPYEEGPILDERRGEGVEDIFVELAREDEGFRDRLDETLAGYFDSEDADPAVAKARPVIRGMLEIVGVLSLLGSGARVRAWLARHDQALRAEADAVLGRAALDALATAQILGTSDGRAFWLGLWRRGPAAWQWRPFVGLRLHDPVTAAETIPELLLRLREQQADPRPLLLGMWKQPAGRVALEKWARTTSRQDAADEVRGALKAMLSPADFAALGKPKPKHPLRQLASNRQLAEAPP